MLKEKQGDNMKRFILLMLCLILSSNLLFAQTAPDRDGDGIPDSSDDCISRAGTRSNNGCPERATSEPQTSNQPQNNPDDSDGDGTNNSADACPDSGGPDWNAGCPVTETEEAPTLSLPSDGECIAAASSNVNRRSLPSMNAEVVDVLPAGQYAPVLSLLHNVQEGTSWYQTAPNSFVNADVIQLGGWCSGTIVIRIDFAAPVQETETGIAFVYEKLDILFSPDETGTLWIAARPHDPAEPIDWITMNEPEPELGIQVTVIPDPADPLHITIAPEGETPLGITMGPIVDPSPGIVLDVSEPDFNTCTFTNHLGEANAASSRSYMILQEKIAYDPWYQQVPITFWEDVMMTEAAFLHFSAQNSEASGFMEASLVNGENLVNLSNYDSFEVGLPNTATLYPQDFDGLTTYRYQLSITNYTVPIQLDIDCVLLN
jgi:hypothetical protein